MKLGVLTVLFQDQPLEETLAYLNSIGIDTVEIGCGGYPGKAHCDPEVLLADPEKMAQFKALFEKYHMTVSAFSAHGNAVHPNPEIAAGYHRDFINACKMAQAFGLKTVVTFSGCPGDCAEAKNPNWVTCYWPNEYADILQWQWEKVLIPYWKSAVEEAKQYGVTQIAFEMHPGFCVYNPATLLRLREAVGPEIGANFDPSHLWWQGIDPVEAIYALKGAIFHFHAKDTKLNERIARVDGFMDTKPFSDEPNRAWLFRSVGYGHGENVWRDIVSALRMTGYDYVMSIEHEDSLMTNTEGLNRAIELLRRVMMFEPKPGEMWWA